MTASVRAAVLRAAHTPLAIETLELADPGPGEVRVRYGASGVCHSDLHCIDGEWTVPLPLVLGHEGAGTVEAVGPGVSGLAPGATQPRPCRACVAQHRAAAAPAGRSVSKRRWHHSARGACHQPGGQARSALPGKRRVRRTEHGSRTEARSWRAGGSHPGLRDTRSRARGRAVSPSADRRASAEILRASALLPGWPGLRWTSRCRSPRTIGIRAGRPSSARRTSKPVWRLRSAWNAPGSSARSPTAARAGPCLVRRDEQQAASGEHRVDLEDGLPGH